MRVARCGSLLPLLFGQREVLCNAVAKGPVFASILDQYDGHVLRAHLSIRRDELCRAAVESTLLLGASPFAQEDLSEHDAIRPFNAEIGWIVDQPGARM